MHNIEEAMKEELIALYVNYRKALLEQRPFGSRERTDEELGEYYPIAACLWNLQNEYASANLGEHGSGGAAPDGG